MGWVWKDEAEDARSNDGADFDNSSPGSCSTRKIVKSQCRTEEVEPGKFVRKCEKTEEILRGCVGRSAEVVQSNKEYTEEDVSDQVKKGSFPPESSELVPFNFPGLRSDMEAIERSLFGNLGRFFDAAEEMANGIFGVFGSPPLYDGDSSARRRGIPIEGHPAKEAPAPPPKLNNPESGDVDISGLVRDV